MPKLSYGFFVLVLLVPLAAQAEDAPCGPLMRFAKVDMSMDAGGAPNITVTIGGKPENLLVETGGLRSMLTPAAEDALGLVRKGMPNSAGLIEMYGGTRIVSYVHAPDITLGKFKIPDVNLMTIPASLIPLDTDGTLAPDLLSYLDVDFDFAGATLSLISQKHCPIGKPYWTDGVYAKIPITMDQEGQIELTLQLDGQDVLAVIDTGSSLSEMSLETAESLFDFDEKSPLLKAGASVSGHAGYRYPFKKLSLGGVIVTNPELVLVSDAVSHMHSNSGYRPPRIILGMDVLRQLHLYIAYKENYIFATPAGQR